MDDSAQNTTTPVVPSSVSQISIGREQGPIQIKSDAEDETPGAQYVPAPQVQEQAGAQIAEVLRPSMPEVVIPQEIDHVMERSAEDLASNTSLVPGDVKEYVSPTEVNGIPAPQNDFGIKTLPMTHDQADLLEKKTNIKSGSHWLADKVKYLWEKVNPTLHK